MDRADYIPRASLRITSYNTLDPTIVSATAAGLITSYNKAVATRNSISVTQKGVTNTSINAHRDLLTNWFQSILTLSRSLILVFEHASESFPEHLLQLHVGVEHKAWPFHC